MGQRPARRKRSAADAGCRNPGAEHPWQAGQLKADCGKLNITQKIVPCYRDQQQLDKDIIPKLLPSVAGHCCFQDKETSLIQRGPTRLASASPSGSNGDDRRQWRKQGGAVGAAASRMRATAKQTLGAATRAVSPQVTERATPPNTTAAS